MAVMHDDDDIFADVHQAEELDVQRGYAAGVSDGMVSGIHEGRELGLQKGYEIGVELGFYAGCVRAWRALQAAEGSPQTLPSPSIDLTSNKTTTDALSRGNVAGGIATQLASLDIQQPGLPPPASVPAPDQGPSSSTTGIVPQQPGSEQDATSTQGPAVAAGDDAGEGAQEGLLIPRRAERSLAGLEQMLQEFPLTDPQDERLQELLDRIRGRFKAVASMLGLLHDYMPREADRQTSQAPAAAGNAPAADLSF